MSNIHHHSTCARRNALRQLGIGFTFLAFGLPGCTATPRRTDGDLADEQARALAKRRAAERDALEMARRQRFADLAAIEKWKWGEADLDAFLEVVGDEGLWALLVSLGSEGPTSNPPQWLDRRVTIARIKREAVWRSSSILSYPMKDKASVPYDELVRWIAGKFEVEPAVIVSTSTYGLEKAIALKTFVDLWDKLVPEQRKQVLAELDPSRTILDHGAVAVMAGTGAAAALASAALLTGFSFYTTMSTVICVSAGWLGVTLPFAVYTSASSTVAFLATNPIGWAIIGIGALVSIAWIGGPNERSTAAFVLQINALRAAASQAAGRKFPS